MNYLWKKLPSIIGWTIALLCIICPGIIISQFGYDKMLEFAKLTIYATSIPMMIWNAIKATMYIITYLFGISLVVMSVILTVFVIREYILPKKNVDDEEQSKTDSDGYTEV